MTVISIFTEPDRCGFPPSTANSFKEMWGCSSRSKGFCKIMTANLIPSALECCFKAKLSLVDKI
uniref:Uncharacterized protein n=1 Tax=Oryzias melastigma TaxID=30732 RepID=A0A3B3D0U4_ORYME